MSAPLSSSGQPRHRRRRPWLSALLSAFFPGLGQVYNAQIRLSFSLIIAYFVTGFLVILLNVVHPRYQLVGQAVIILTLMEMCLWFFGIVNAFLFARRERHPRRRSRLAFGAAMIIAPLPYITLFTDFSPNIENMPSRDMMPTVMEGEWYFVLENYYATRDPEKGDVIAYEHWKGWRPIFVGRVIALPNETIAFPGTRLEINEEPVTLLEADSDRTDGAEADASGRKAVVEVLPNGASYETFPLSEAWPNSCYNQRFLVSDGEYFLLGDNRDVSLKRRHCLIMVPRENIIGRPTYVVWSSSLARIGTPLQPRTAERSK